MRVLWVFSENVSYLGEGERSPASAEVLGAHLLGRSPFPPSVGAARWSAAARIERARQLLFALLAHHRSQSDRNVVLERLVREEWAWVAGSPAARACVLSTVAGGGEDPERLTDAVLARIASDLQPIVRLYSALESHRRGLTVARQYVSELINWSVPDPLAHEMGEAYVHFLALVQALGVWPGPSIDANVRTLSRASDVRTRRRLLSAYAQAHLGMLEAARPADIPLARLDERAAALARISGELDEHRVLIEAASAFQLAAGTRKVSISGREAEGLLHLAYALALDPISKPPRQGLADAADLPDSLQKALDGKPLSNESRRLLEQVVRSLRTGLARAHEYLVGEEAGALRRRHHRALLADISNGLSITGTESERQAAARTVAGCLEEAARKFQAPAQSSADQQFELACQVVTTARASLPPELASGIPWERVQSAFVRAGQVGGWLLAYALEQPAAVDLKSWGDDQSLPEVPPAKTRAIGRAAWLWSRRDLRFKGLAALGILMMLQVSATVSLGAFRTGRIESRYRAVLAAEFAHDDPGVIASARGFLRTVAGDHSQAGRVTQVTELYGAAVIRQMVRLRGQGKTPEAARLLAQYESAVPGSAPPSSNLVVSMTPREAQP